MNDIDLKTDKASMADKAGAEPLRWNSIDWEKAESHVNRLQTRIAMAASEGKWERVRKLQRQLTNSLHAKMVAVRRVTTNKGRKTPGVDGELWNTPAKKMKAVLSLSGKGYKAKPLKRVYIEKKGGKNKKRPLGIPTMHDRAMQALYALALEPVAEVTGDRHSYGFRKGRCAQDAYVQLFSNLGNKHSSEWVLEGDIKGCFDHISHDWLMEHIPMDKKVLKQFLEAGFMEKGEWHETEEGTPQGGIISPILANMALDGIDRLLDERFHFNKSGKIDSNVARKYKVNFVRYADDFVITAISPEVAKEAKAIVAEFLLVRGLELSEEKTLITHIRDGFDFLGWSFQKRGHKVIGKPSKQSVKSFLREMHYVILRKGRTWTQEKLITELTPKILGYVGYHRHACSSDTYTRIDHEVYQMLYGWAKRRHGNKNKAWRRKKYWSRIGGRSYVFGHAHHYLPIAAWQHIVRNPALKTDMNPFLNPEYFERRKTYIQDRNAHSFRQAAARRS